MVNLRLESKFLLSCFQVYWLFLFVDDYSFILKYSGRRVVLYYLGFMGKTREKRTWSLLISMGIMLKEADFLLDPI